MKNKNSFCVIRFQTFFSNLSLMISLSFYRDFHGFNFRKYSSNLGFHRIRVCGFILSLFKNSEILVGELKMCSKIYEVQISKSSKGLRGKVYKLEDKSVVSVLKGGVSVSLPAESGFNFLGDKVVVNYERDKIIYGILLKRSGNILYISGYSFFKEELNKYLYFDYLSFLEGNYNFVLKNNNTGLFSFTELSEVCDLNTPGKVLIKKGNKISVLGAMKMEVLEHERDLDLSNIIKEVKVIVFFRTSVILGDLIKNSDRNIVIKGISFLAVDFFTLVQLRGFLILDPSIEQVRQWPIR